MLRKPVNRLDTPLVRAINEVGDAWTLLILWSAIDGATRFDAFQSRLGVARNILAERLRRMTDAELLYKAPISDGARRMEYRVTPKGRALEQTLRQLHAWGSAWTDEPEHAGDGAAQDWTEDGAQEEGAGGSALRRRAG